MNDEGLLHQIKVKYQDAIFISAKKKIRLERIKKMIYELLKSNYIEKQLSLNYNQVHIMHKIGEISHIIDKKFLSKKIRLKIRIANENENKLINLLH